MTIIHYNKRYGNSVTLEDFYSDDLTAWGVSDVPSAIKRFHEYLKTDEFIKQQPMQGALEVIRWLKRHHELHIVTGRPNFIEAATKTWLADHFPDVFTSAVFTDFYKLESDGGAQAKSLSKAEVCLRIGADVLIDDHLGHASEAAEAEVTVLLFGDYPWNRAASLPYNVIRAKDWPAVKEYFSA